MDSSHLVPDTLRPLNRARDGGGYINDWVLFY